MRIGDVNIRPIVASSGTFGFRGEGYWYHRYLWPFLIWLKLFGEIVFKTVTANDRVGNMPLNNDATPRDKFPKCIFIDWIRWCKGSMLNAVGLSNKGARYHLSDPELQAREGVVIISFMPVEQTFEARMEEARIFVRALMEDLHNFQGKIIIEINLSCANTGGDICLAGDDNKRIVEYVGREAGCPTIAKISVDMSVQEAKVIADSPYCHAIDVSNALAFSKLPWWIKELVFGDLPRDEEGEIISPLAEYGGGAYSGKYLLPMVLGWIRRARAMGIIKPIIGGGGVLTPLDVYRIYRSGASAVAMASVVMLRPFWVPFNVLTAWVLFSLRGEMK